MKFNFVKTQLKHCPDVVGWYLKLDPKDNEMFLFIHKVVTHTNFLKAKKDPHIQGEMDKGSFLAYITHPITLSAKWLMAMEENRFNQRTVLVNSMGGWMPMDNQVNVIDEVQEDKFEFPADKYDEREYLTIARFPDGTHWYICSNKARMFEKFNDFESAFSEAKRHVPEDRITVKDNPVQKLREGD